MKHKIKISDIFAYLVGNYRYAVYNSIVRWLLRYHIIEQYEYRLKMMNEECYLSGSCTKCGCDTPQLQMASKACKGKCYPRFMKEEVWEKFKLKTKNTTYIAGIDPYENRPSIESKTLFTFQTSKGPCTLDYNEWLQQQNFNNKNNELL